ncbi:class I SAM-dependent DNA methyltransferase [Sulfitobacter aestuariivivens]|uniref:Class I SAM-dependent methyltransferase n=1 Tax=Sulfitobacter aestuariivivens TaxID=2766981 RepID=A0A927DA13_9RHOB|nr:class I SAM-dependent methyltransferase [Sulfitobacter aestuariivivens]MBD3665461.1 class I SAM-dependent methyltransferase [Sulfitobacter aestuariivivens]
MTRKKPTVDTAYALETPEDSKRLYAQWADTYDQTFAADMDYLMPHTIAEAFVAVGKGRSPVLDVGAGTGLLVAHEAMRDVPRIDALDISPEMLRVAGGRGVYDGLIQGDLTQTLPIEDNTYAAILSAGTFTHGHVGPDALDELMRIAKPGAVFVLGINAAHYAEQGFEAKLAALEPHIQGLMIDTVPIYGPGADDAHRDDQAHVVTFFKSPS